MELTEKKLDHLYKRSLKIVVFAQILGGAGLAAGITVGSLIAKDILGAEKYSGVPVALFTLGSALSAFLVGRFSQKYGRRIGLSFGFFAGGIGALGVILATAMENIALLFLMLFIYGAGMSTNLQLRYAGADLAQEDQRGRAVSIALVSTTLGAVFGPNLVGPMGGIAESLYLPVLSGPFILAAAAYIFAGLTLFLYLKPDPLFVAREIERKKEEAKDSEGEMDITVESTHDRFGIILGALVLVLSHFVMVAVMTMTPVHMQVHGASLSAVGFVIGLHIAAMYLPSLGTGVLVDRIGRTPMVVASSLTLALAAIMAAYVPGESTTLLTVALILLGLGWNFGLISGTAIIIDSTNLNNRAKAQGSVDVWVAISGTAGSLLSGIIVGYMSYTYLGIIGMFIALLILPLLLLQRELAAGKSFPGD